MEKSRYTAEEIAFVLRRVEEETVLQVGRKMGVAEKTFYQCKKVTGAGRGGGGTAGVDCRGAAPDGEVCGGLNCSSSYIISARFSSLHTPLERGQGSR